MKICGMCKEDKPFNMFGTRKRTRKDGSVSECYRSMCNKCRGIREKITPDKREEYNAKMAQQRLNRLSKMTPEERAAARKKQNAWQKIWRQNNPDKVFELKQRFREKHKEKIAAKKARDAKTPHGRALERERYHRYYAKHSETILERSRIERATLHPSYVKGLLFRHKVPAHLIPDELVEARKVYTQIKRQLKEKEA
jgi:hypothetical protein